jgi:uncharacterized repeat protein (TIGR01451 family)
LLLIAAFQSVLAQEEEKFAPILDDSEKIVDKENAEAGSTLKYTVIIKNQGDIAANNVMMTDTLPAMVDYVPGTLSVIGGGNYSPINGTNRVVTWTGAVNNGSQIEIQFDTVVTNTVISGTLIENIAEISYDSMNLDRTSVTTITESSKLTETIIYLPGVWKPKPEVVLAAIGRPSPANEWALNWSVLDPTQISAYEIEEAHNPDFSDAILTEVGSTPFRYEISKQPEYNNVYYYRIRAKGAWGVGPWSNVESVIGGYRDDFQNNQSGWAMRREDTDSVINDEYYQNGKWIHEMDSSYDYLISSPLAKAPPGPYRIEARVQLVGVDNLHSYGIIFGGDWNGQTCPNSEFSSCFNQYYRLNIIWSGNLGNRMTIQMKRIDYHEVNDNVGRGQTLFGPITVPVNDPPEDWQRWAVDVYPDGRIRVYVNDKFIREVYDTSLVNRSYFGAFSSTDEYNGLQVEFDWYQVTLLPK